MLPTTTLLVLSGLMGVLVGGYLFLFRPLDRRVVLLGLTLVFSGLIYAFAFRAELNPLYLASSASMATFLGFAALFPSLVRPRSLSGASLVAGAAWLLASLVYVIAVQDASRLAMLAEALQVTPALLRQLIGPSNSGNAVMMALIILARLYDLRNEQGDTLRAAPYFLIAAYAQVFTATGYVTGQLISREIWGADQVAQVYAFLTTFILVFYVTPFAIALFGAIRLRWWIPFGLMGAGLVTSIPLLVNPILDFETSYVLRLWGGVLGPALVLYAQARWNALPGEPRGVAPTIAITALAALIMYVFASIILTIMLPDSGATSLFVPLAALIAAVATATLVLPRARRLELRRILDARYQGPLSPGVVVLGRYRVTRLLAEGGQGRVYEAVETRKPGRRVVLKAVSSHDGLREARVLKKLRHPNIVPFLEIVEVPGSTLIVLEFAQGGTLRGLLNRRGRLGADEAATIADGVLSGLAAAHQAGVTHGDVKAENVLFDPAGTPMLADFGVARGPQSGQTLNSRSSGTLAYMAPEQVRGHAGDERSDVYAAAILVHEVLTGKAPIPIDPSDEFQARKAILTRPPRVALPSTADALSAVLRKALAEDPGERPENATRLRASLREAWPAGWGARVGS